MFNSDKYKNYTQYGNDNYIQLYDDEIKNIRTNYKVIDVDWLDRVLVDYKIFGDDYFIKSPEKKGVIKDMLDFYLTDKDSPIYKKTDYLCNKQEKICICNMNADGFRKIFDGINYKENTKYISWCKKDKF